MTLLSVPSHAAPIATSKGVPPDSALSNLEVQNPLLTFAIEAAGSVQSVVSPAFGGLKSGSQPEFAWQISPITPAPRGIIARAGAMLGRELPVVESALVLSLRGADGTGVTLRCVLANASEYPELLPQALQTPNQALRALHHLASVSPHSSSPAAKVSQDISRYALLPLAQRLGAGEATHWSEVLADTQRKALESIAVRAGPALRQAA